MREVRLPSPPPPGSWPAGRTLGDPAPRGAAGTANRFTVWGPSPAALLHVRAAVAAALLALVALGVWASRRGSDGDPYRPPVSRIPEELVPEAARGELAVLGFRSRFCLACRRTPDVVGEALALAEADAVFVHVDVADHPRLVDELALRETPTVLLVDAEGRLRYAREGNPSPGELAAYLEEAQASPGGDPGLLSAVEDAVRG